MITGFVGRSFDRGAIAFLIALAAIALRGRAVEA
jgi:hypothetical protein